MSLSNWSDFTLIRSLNTWPGNGKGKRGLEQELESRIPHIEPEYNSNGNVIASEVIGYDNEGNEVYASIYP